MKINNTSKKAAKTLLLVPIVAMIFSRLAFAEASSGVIQSDNTPAAATVKIQITVGNKNFSASLYDNETTRALIARLPMTVDMIELNGNEKYYHLPDRLPAKNASRPELIRAGDIMLYSGYSLVLFYETFSTSYPYVRLGNVDDGSQLAVALGPGDVKVTFSVRD